MPAPAVSIIMPAFNRERYLAESIESVLNQTFSDWELIVVDDGSSDSTPAIIERYRLSFPRYQRLGARRHRLGHDRVRLRLRRAAIARLAFRTACARGDGS